MTRPERWHNLRDEKTGRFVCHSLSSAAVKQEVSPPPGFKKTPAFKKKDVPTAPLGLKKKATVITRKEKHLTALMMEKQLAVARRKEKKALPTSSSPMKKKARQDMPSSLAVASRAMVRKSAVVIAVDSDSEEEGEPMEARRKESVGGLYQSNPTIN